jgi:hypothetical protein
MKFHERFEIKIGLDEAKAHFVNRVHNMVWSGYLLNLHTDRRFFFDQAIASALGREYEHKYVGSQIGKGFLDNLLGLGRAL